MVGGLDDNLQLVSMNSAAVLQAPRAAASRHSESKSLHTGGTCIDGRARGIGTMPCVSLLGCTGCPTIASASANMPHTHRQKPKKAASGVHAISYVHYHRNKRPARALMDLRHVFNVSFYQSPLLLFACGCARLLLRS